MVDFEWSTVCDDREDREDSCDIVDHMENCSNMDDKGTCSSPFRMVNLGFPFHHMTSKLFLCENI